MVALFFVHGAGVVPFICPHAAEVMGRDAAPGKVAAITDPHGNFAPVAFAVSRASRGPMAVAAGSKALMKAFPLPALAVKYLLRRLRQ